MTLAVLSGIVLVGTWAICRLAIYVKRALCAAVMDLWSAFLDGCAIEMK